MSALVAALALVKEFPVRSGVLARRVATVHAVSGVDLDVAAGETVALVGESGSGKTTTGRLVLHLERPTGGTVRFDGQDLSRLPTRDLRILRRRMQVVFQDPHASLNPRMRVGHALAEPLRVHGRLGRPEAGARVAELLDVVGLSVRHAARYPHELSGGERQRVSIARALALEPDFVLLDEPLSALDVSIQAGIVNLLADLQRQRRLAYLFIAHDLAVVRQVADRVAVMYLGKIVEEGTRDDVYGRAAHPYTQALLSAVPVPDPRVERARRRIVLTGEPPSAITPPSGCRFRTRCWKAQEICAVEEPALVDRGQGHPVACHFAETSAVLDTPAATKASPSGRGAPARSG